MPGGSILWLSIFFAVLGLILLMVLACLYKLMLAIGRLDRRLEKLALHLRDLNLYDLHPAVPGVFGTDTEFEHVGEGGTDALLTPTALTGRPSTPAGNSSGQQASDNGADTSSEPAC